jgi:RNA polymerase sigma-70 factor (ECF subfamily)
MEIDSESTSDLLDQARDGSEAACDRLVRRYLPILKRWAHGRLPASARGLAETDDLVQVTLTRAVRRAAQFESRREGAFLAYLRRTLLNALRDEIRRSTRAPGLEPLHDELLDPRPSILEQAIGREAMQTYEMALASLPEINQEAVILRVEFGFGYDHIATMVGSPSADAARMMVSRSLLKLAEALHEHR